MPLRRNSTHEVPLFCTLHEVPWIVFSRLRACARVGDVLADGDRGCCFGCERWLSCPVVQESELEAAREEREFQEQLRRAMEDSQA